MRRGIIIVVYRFLITAKKKTLSGMMKTNPFFLKVTLTNKTNTLQLLVGQIKTATRSTLQL